MNENGWVVLDSDTIDKQINTSEKVSINGMKATVRFSPYNVPVALRVRKDEHRQLIVEFQYIQSGEPTQSIRVNDDVSVELGKKSHRVYSFAVPEQKNSSPRVGELLASTFDKVVKNLLKNDRDDNADNYNAARKALSISSDKMFATALASNK